MSKWKIVKLEEICELITDGTHQTPTYCDEGYVFLSSKNVTNKKIDWDNVKYIPKELHDKLYERLAPQINDILLAKNGTTGVAALVDREYVFDIYVSLALLRPNKKVYPPYLLNVINSPQTKRQFNKKLKGIGVPNLHLKEIKNTKIPLPPYQMQKNISDTLDKASEIINLHKKRLGELDNLIKATFYDMFGDPYINQNNWNVVKLGDILSVLTDYHSNGSYKTLRDNVKLLDTPDYALMIRTTDLEKEDFTNDVKYISKHAYEHLEKSKVFGGEIIINKIGSAGKVYLMPHLNRPVSLAMNQFLLRFNNVNEVYAYYNLTTEYSTKNINDKVRGAVTKTITKDAIRDIPFVLPPIELQNKFAKIVTEIEEQKILEKQAISESDNLFNSLMSKYFE